MTEIYDVEREILFCAVSMEERSGKGFLTLRDVEARFFGRC
jgi:hypothetical protein